MTLKEMLDLRIIRDNVQIREFIPSADGLGTLETLCDVVRSYSIVEEKTLLDKGLDAKYLDYDIIEMWGTSHKYKLGIVIKSPKR